MPAIEYEGFELSASPYQFPDTGEWGVMVVVTKHHDLRSETLEKRFSASNPFKNKEDAERHAIQFGKDIIDGKHATLSVDDLL